MPTPTADRMPPRLLFLQVVLPLPPRTAPAPARMLVSYLLLPFWFAVLPAPAWDHLHRTVLPPGGFCTHCVWFVRFYHHTACLPAFFTHLVAFRFYRRAVRTCTAPLPHHSGSAASPPFLPTWIHHTYRFVADFVRFTFLHALPARHAFLGPVTAACTTALLPCALHCTCILLLVSPFSFLPRNAACRLLWDTAARTPWVHFTTYHRSVLCAGDRGLLPAACVLPRCAPAILPPLHLGFCTCACRA